MPAFSVIVTLPQGAGQWHITPCLHDVAAAFCSNVPQAKRVFSRAQRCKRCCVQLADLFI